MQIAQQMTKTPVGTMNMTWLVEMVIISSSSSLRAGDGNSVVSREGSVGDGVSWVGLKSEGGEEGLLEAPNEGAYEGGKEGEVEGRKEGALDVEDGELEGDKERTLEGA